VLTGPHRRGRLLRQYCGDAGLTIGESRCRGSVSGRSATWNAGAAGCRNSVPVDALIRALCLPDSAAAALREAARAAGP
jgi:hypothetical protein